MQDRVNQALQPQNNPTPHGNPGAPGAPKLVPLQLPPALADRGITQVLAWQTPMRVQFRNITVREGLFLRGPEGAAAGASWGEFSPFWDYDAAESATWLAAGIAQATGELPPRLRQSVPLNATVPAISAEQVERMFRGHPAAAVKVKVAQPGQPLSADLDRLAAVREVFGPAVAIRVDANAAWDSTQALRVIPQLDVAAAGLDYVEQPCAALADLALLRRRLDVLIAADESVRRAADPLAVVRAEAADVLVVKQQPLGGVAAALQILEAAQLPVVASSALDTSLGIWAGAHLAAATDLLYGPCGLGTTRFFAADPASPTLPVEGANLDLHNPSPQPDWRFLTSDVDLSGRWQTRLAQIIEISMV